MFKMYLEDVRWDGKEVPCLLVFKNSEDGGLLSIEISETIGFDLRMLLNQKLSGYVPYLGICEFIAQIGGSIKKLSVKNFQKPGTAEMLVEIGGKIKEVELFFADVVSASIVLDMPIFFDDSVCAKLDLPLASRLLWQRTESATNYSFETNG